MMKISDLNIKITVEDCLAVYRNLLVPVCSKETREIMNCAGEAFDASLKLLTINQTDAFPGAVSARKYLQESFLNGVLANKEKLAKDTYARVRANKKCTKVAREVLYAIQQIKTLTVEWINKLIPQHKVTVLANPEQIANVIAKTVSEQQNTTTDWSALFEGVSPEVQMLTIRGLLSKTVDSANSLRKTLYKITDVRDMLINGAALLDQVKEFERQYNEYLNANSAIKAEV